MHDSESSKLDISGNFGTLDTIKALEWINKNIQFFGGDPDNVTVFGESAGGHNAAAIFASPLAEGLYHKVIVQSGIMSSSSIEAAESYVPENGIAPSRSGLEVFNHVLVANNLASSLAEARLMQNQMSDAEIRTLFYEQDADILLTSSRDARPKRSGMTRVFPDGHVILRGGIEESFNNPSLKRVPIISGTNKDENKFFNSMNREFVKWGPATGLYKTVGIDEMPIEIIDQDYYEAINFYGSSFWKQRAVDTPSSNLIKSGHKDTYAYRFDWDELTTINDMDFSKLIGAAHALEILFVFGSFDSYVVKNFLFGDGAYPKRILMADLPQYARIIPNTINNVPGFFIDDHYFMPGFPEMAWPMIDWVIKNQYEFLINLNSIEDQSIWIDDVSESKLIDTMQRIQKKNGGIKIYSLPKLRPKKMLEIGLPIVLILLQKRQMLISHLVLKRK